MNAVQNTLTQSNAEVSQRSTKARHKGLLFSAYLGDPSAFSAVNVF